MIDLLGYLAGAFLLMMAMSKSQLAMRRFNIAGNATFIVYGFLGQIWPILVLNSVMLMIHVYRIFQIQPTDNPRA